LKRLLFSIILFIIGSLGDNFLTYKYVVLERKFFEANPFTAPRVYTQPLWMWFIYDFAGLLLTLAIAFGYYKLMLWLSRRDPPWKRARIVRIASKYWLIVLIVAVLRFSPVVHNLLLICFGYESPLPNIAYEIGKFMGVAP